MRIQKSIGKLSRGNPRWIAYGLAVGLVLGMVSCGGDSPPAYSVGGTVSGLAAGRSLVMQINGKDEITVASNGPFRFSNKLENGVPYALSIVGFPFARFVLPSMALMSSGARTSNRYASIAGQCQAGIFLPRPA